MENSWRQKRREQLGKQKGIGPTPETSDRIRGQPDRSREILKRE